MTFFMILMVVIMIALYGLVCFYIGYNGWIWLKTTFLGKYKKTYIGILSFLSISLFVSPFVSVAILEIISSMWMVLIVFGILFLPFINIIYFVLKKRYTFWVGNIVILLFIALAIYGSYNAWSPVVKTYNIEIEKTSDVKQLKILMASDFHLGNIVGANHLTKFVDIVKEEEPDLILLPGDIINDHIEPFKREKMNKILEEIAAPLGVYAVLGNHDYYGDDNEALVKEMKKIGIHMLEDEWMNVDNLFYIVGRKEHTDDSRGKLADWLTGLDKRKPIILLDHQPRDLEEALKNGVDLIVSGHTHGGQIAPANVVTDLLFENDYGYYRKESLHSITTSGFGLWGPPLRIGTRSEVVIINVIFKG
jgi:uncharacterized protein